MDTTQNIHVIIEPKKDTSKVILTVFVDDVNWTELHPHQRVYVKVAINSFLQERNEAMKIEMRYE